MTPTLRSYNVTNYKRGRFRPGVDYDSPESVTAGDVLLLFLVASGSGVENGDNFEILVPEGFELVTSNSGGNSRVAAVYYKILTSSEPSEYVFWFRHKEGGSSSASISANVVVYRNVDTASPIEVVGDWTDPGGNQNSIVVPGITTLSNDSVIVSFFKTGDDVALTEPVSMTERLAVIHGDNDHSIVIADEVVSTPSSTGTRTATTSATEPGTLGVMVALKPAGTVTFVTSGAEEDDQWDAYGVAKPPDIQSGDLIILIPTASQGLLLNLNPDPPTGFSLVTKDDVGVSAPQAIIYYKIAGGSEPDIYPVIQNNASSVYAQSGVFAFHSVDTENPFDVIGSWSNQSNEGTANQIIAQGITVTQDDCLMLGLFRSNSASNPVINIPEEMTELAIIGDAGGSNTYIVAEQRDAGSTGNRVATDPFNSAITTRLSVLIALAPGEPWVDPGPGDDAAPSQMMMLGVG